MGRPATAERPGRPQRSFENLPRRAGEAHLPTVRDFLPWHVVGEKLAARPSNDDEPSAPSGIRIGGKEKEPATAAADVNANANADGVSFKVYTIAELDKRSSDAPPPLRMSMTMLAAQPKAPTESPWAKTGKALLAVLVTLRTWALMGKGRPALGDAIRAPGVVLKIELKAALATVEWRRLGVALGIGLGTALFLLFTVLTVAELTDDLKPASAEGTRMAIPKEPAAMTTITSHTSQPAVAVPEPAPALALEPAPAPALALEPVVDELDELDELDDIPPAKAPPPARPAKKPAAKRPPPKKSFEPFSL